MEWISITRDEELSQQISRWRGICFWEETSVIIFWPYSRLVMKIIHSNGAFFLMFANCVHAKQFRPILFSRRENFLRTIKLLCGHVECSFDNPVENFLLKTANSFHNNFLRKNFSGHVECSSDNPAGVFFSFWNKKLGLPKKTFALDYVSSQFICIYCFSTLIVNFRKKSDNLHIYITKFDEETVIFLKKKRSHPSEKPLWRNRWA